MAECRTTLCALFMMLAINLCSANQWESAVNSNCNISSTSDWCNDTENLTSAEGKFCSEFAQYTSHINRGACIGLRQCRNVFINHRWNCVTGRVLKVPSRETAYVQAITAAGLLNAVNRGDISPTNTLWKGTWYGLQEVIGRGYRFAVQFLRNYGITVTRKTKQGRMRRLMAAHNHKVGLLVARSISRHKCRCTGPPDACELEACWMTFNMTEVARLLKVKYDQAVSARFTRGRVLPKYSRGGNITSETLIYIESSPDYCLPDRRLGLPGSRGRQCNKNSVGPDSCEILCCGRGYRYAHSKQYFVCN